MLQRFRFCLISMVLCGGLNGCIATKVVTTTVGVATKATVMTVKTTGKVAKGTAGLLVPDGDEEPDSEADAAEESGETGG